MHIGSCPDTVIVLCCPVPRASHTGFNFPRLAIGQFIFPKEVKECTVTKKAARAHHVHSDFEVHAT